jgi:hypothetical protein
MSIELILSSLSNAFDVVTKPPVRSATIFEKVTSPIPEMLLSGYSVVIRQVTGDATGEVTCAGAVSAHNAAATAKTSATQMRGKAKARAREWRRDRMAITDRIRTRGSMTKGRQGPASC